MITDDGLPDAYEAELPGKPIPPTAVEQKLSGR